MKKGDWIAASCLLFVGIAICFFSTSRNDGRLVEIYANGQLCGTYKLSTDKTICISTEFGTNMVIIQNSRVRVSESSCPDKLEVSAGGISKGGQCLICLPNRLVVAISGGEELDGVSY